MKQFIAILFIAFAFTCQGQITGDFHVILAGATNAPKISEGTIKNLNNMKVLWKDIAESMNRKIHFYELDGMDFTKDKLENIIAQVNQASQPGSIIIYYSASHGFRYNNTSGNEPYLMVHPTLEDEVSESDLENFSKRITTIQNGLVDEQKFLLCLAEACNQSVGIDESSSGRNVAMSFSPRSVEQLKRLFGQTGYYISTSSIPTQLSWTNEGFGGYFTHSFIRSFNEIVKGQEPATWEDIFNLTERYTIELSREISKTDAQVTEQKPWHKGKVNRAAPIRLKKNK